MQDRRLIDEVRRRHEPDLAEPMLYVFMIVF
jgi:hypothetical protein